MNISRLYRRIFKKTLKTYWWRYDHPATLNFGDEITPLLVERIFGLKPVWSEPDQCDLAGVGSIIEVLQAEACGNVVHVWGSGFIQEGPPNDMANLRFHAVRGKSSLQRVTAHKTIPLGDPGLLLPIAFPPKAQSAAPGVIGILPHYVDKEQPLMTALQKDKRFRFINVFDSVEKVVEAVTACEIVLSSSLHGLIVADAYGVPNGRLVLSDKLTGGNYKFHDYYSAFSEDRALPNFSGSKKSDVLRAAERVRTAYKPIPPNELSRIQHDLIRAFPF